MKSELITVAFYVSIAVVVVAALLAFARSASQTVNRAAALSWIETMDVQHEKQRYQGIRTEIVADFASGKSGSTGYEVFAACQTKSGRTYFLSVTSSLGRVIDWAIYPTTAEQMISMLEQRGLDSGAVRSIPSAPIETATQIAAPPNPVA
ncbi:hypothetical protein J7E62_25645 [Variovorax paradoxus]|nr:hypothetical protein [Variovorax paradoxus]